ncbi:MAG TPA: hypothetical protein VGO93_07705 [Candidatus Xenobia bacterium]
MIRLLPPGLYNPTFQDLKIVLQGLATGKWILQEQGIFDWRVNDPDQPEPWELCRASGTTSTYGRRTTKFQPTFCKCWDCPTSCGKWYRKKLLQHYSEVFSAHQTVYGTAYRDDEAAAGQETQTSIDKTIKQRACEHRGSYFVVKLGNGWRVLFTDVPLNGTEPPIDQPSAMPSLRATAYMLNILTLRRGPEAPVDYSCSRMGAWFCRKHKPRSAKTDEVECHGYSGQRASARAVRKAIQKVDPGSELLAQAKPGSPDPVQTMLSWGGYTVPQDAADDWPGIVETALNEEMRKAAKPEKSG